ncbi:hypothetical protein GWK47_007093 [Chionoecetes opilio]|uniref:Uncharacterized protein n=1 Tax=Chionoecetes opilio TaxID=41210 RepID=A0A8J5CT76_CHIOP|nr:hypothetical protein GWK47_007093 [Chionoecetes opilio]
MLRWLLEDTWGLLGGIRLDNRINSSRHCIVWHSNSFLTASHLTKTRHAHQVSALALAKMQRDAHQEAVGETPSNDEGFEAWRRDMAARSPTFHYWDTILRLEILGLIFVRAHREQDFPLYVETLKALVPWFFALDHQNYARWLPVHIRDMESLPQQFNTNRSQRQLGRFENSQEVLHYTH